MSENLHIIHHPRLLAATTELWFSDVHFKDHDPQAWELAIAVAEILQPDILYHGGDIWDFYQLSRFSKDPRRIGELYRDIQAGRKELDRLWAVSKKSQKIYMGGNHEYGRLLKWLWDKNPELIEFPQMQLCELLQLDPKQVIMVPPEHLYKVGELYHAHGDEFPASKTNPARDIFRSFMGSIIFGHWHTFSLYYHRVRARNQMQGAFGIGCLYTLDPKYTKFPQWQQGVGKVTYTPEGLFHVDQIPFFRTKRNKLGCVLDGKLVTV